MSSSGAMPTLIVCGLAREAALVADRGVAVVMSGGRREELERRLALIDPAEFGAVVSFGLAGALDPSLRVGDVVLPRIIVAGGDSYVASPDLAALWTDAAPSLGLSFANRDAIAGVDAPLLTADAKHALRRATGAAAVDMESHVAAAFAQRHALPFGVLRVISDEAAHAIPEAALAAMRPDGGIDAPAVLRSLARDPRQVPALIATARNGARAFRVLGGVGRLLGRGLSLNLR